MRKKKNSSGDGISANNWMTTFSDLVTLLLTFFVLLFSMSSMDEQKLKIAFQNFSGGSGLLSYKEYSEISRPMEVLIEGLHQTFEEKVVADNVTESDFGDDIAGNLKHFGNLMDLEPLSDGLKISFGASVLFESGKAEISQEFLVILSHIAKFLSVSGYQAYIEGHTDNIPISDNALYNSNEDLSIARALSIRDHLLQMENIPLDQLAVTGYGELKPLASNDLPEGRAKNRRIDIILKNHKYF